MEKKYVKMGSCHKVHGIKGEFEFWLLNPDQSHLQDESFIYIPTQDDLEFKEYQIEKIRFGQKIIVKLAYVDTRNLAESLIPFDFYSTRDAFEQIGSDEFYWIDMMGAEVFENEQLIGHLDHVLSNRAQDILVIKLLTYELIQIPYVKNFVEKVDIEKKQLHIKTPKLI